MNGEAVRKVVSAAAAAEGKLVSETVVPTIVEVNSELLGVTFHGILAFMEVNPVSE